MNPVADLPEPPLQAPATHGQALVVPRQPRITPLLQGNRERTALVAAEIGGVDYQRLRAMARTELLQAAQRYVSDYLASGPLPPDGAPLILVGHQPELFHPGVWFKNFLLSELGARQQAVALHLITDQDVSRQGGIRVPAGSVGAPAWRFVPWDSPERQLPAEELRVQDRSCWNSFGERVAEAVRDFVPQPLIRRLWPAVRATAEDTPPAHAISRARHLLERSWGLRTWEVPLSAVCGGPAFLHFVGHILEHLPGFHQVFHQALFEHRRQHRIRSHTHPFPALRSADDLLETPFWIWTSSDPRRRPLWLRKQRDAWQLLTLEHTNTAFQTSIRRPGPVVPQLLELPSRGVKIRPRALTTTMFARLLLCDLFIHGLGGSKYDRLTDSVLERFWGVEPPGYLTATATVRLPGHDREPPPDDLRCLRAELRDLRYHPEHHLDGLTDAERQWATLLADRKRQLVGSLPPRGQRRGWHHEMMAINEELRQLSRPVAARLEQLRTEAETARRAQDLLQSREFPFCIFPEDELCPLLLDMARRTA